jgi:hypothetical protein
MPGSRTDSVRPILRARLSFELLESRQMLSGTPALLSDWAGLNNTAAPNSYSASTLAAGGTFDARRFGSGQSAGYLADTALSTSGGALTATTAGGFGAAGTLTFDASLDNTSLADPVFYFGFFDKDDLTKGAFGFSPADSSTTAFRFRSSAGTTQTSGSGVVVQQGTYAFDLDVNNADSGAGRVRFRLFNPATTAIVLDVNVTIPAGSTLQADSFGFLQPAATSGSDVTFSMTISNVNYSGETLYPVPLPGDYDNSGQVDAADYVWWRSNAGTNTIAPNDPTPGDVGPDDYTTWRAHFGEFLPVPTAPTNLAAAPAAGQVSLTWLDTSTGESGFAIERRLGTSGAFMQVATIGPNATGYTDSGLTALETYQYQVRALSSVGSSGPSNIATATLPQVTISAVNYSRSQIYHSPVSPGWTSWVGAWLMPDGSIMVGVTQAKGPFPPNPNYQNRDYSGLDVDVVYLRSHDGGANWTKVTESDVSFTTAEDSGLGTHANNAPATLVLNDGSIIRRVYGWDYGEFPDMPGTAFVQRSTDGGLTWSDQPRSTDGGQTWSNPSPIAEFFLDPQLYTVQPTRFERLSDGRILMIGSVWNGPNTQSAPHEPLLMVSSDEAVSWTRVPFAGPAWSPSYTSLFANEWDATELRNGELLVVSRVQNQNRWQAVFSKTENTWQITSAGATTIPHSGHPELLTTREGPVIYFATTGSLWTNNAGQTWNPLRVDSLPDLAGGDHLTRYYPNSLQTPDGWVYVFGHNGADNYYGQVDQSVWMDKFRLVVQAAPGTGAEVDLAEHNSTNNSNPLAASSNFGEMSTTDARAPSAQSITIGAPSAAGSNSVDALLLMRLAEGFNVERGNYSESTLSLTADVVDEAISIDDDDWPSLDASDTDLIDRVTGTGIELKHLLRAMER